MKKFSVLAIFLILALSIVAYPNASFGQAQQTAGGVDVDGTWYLGEGLKKGDYFEYSLCELDLNDCAPVTFKMWIAGDVTNGSEELWDAKVVVIDGNKIVKGSMGLGKKAPEPIVYDPQLHDYALAFKSSLAWLSAFATGNEDDFIHGPKAFRDKAWGKIGAIGGSQLIPKRAETVQTGAGSFESVVVGWYSGNNNEIWLVDDFPFPVKALTFAWVTTGIAPIMYQFDLRKYQENMVEDPFVDVQPTVSREEKLGCTTDFKEYTSKRESTNTFSMSIQYNYSPQHPKEGCNIDWKINFYNKYNDAEFIDQVHYDIWVVNDKGERLRSIADDLGRASLFTGFGQVHLLMPIDEKAGLVNYAIFVHGTGPEFSIPNAEMGGYLIIPIQIDENPLLHEATNNTEPTTNIPDWIKNNAGWWADGQIDDNSFVQGIQWLIQEDIMKIPPTTQGSGGGNEIPDWIKNNAGWWADGQIDDNSFVQGLQWLIQEGIMKITA